jgi:hypothetical protein
VRAVFAFSISADIISLGRLANSHFFLYDKPALAPWKLMEVGLGVEQCNSQMAA